ncbi:MAG TPA: neutral zinc metallopeptidase [Acidimicrobiia bacterium]|nr:neutral zinc metallopeptidase [Acidimicrobiia bacterium]
MRWRRLERSPNVQDRRGMPSRRTTIGGGGAGIVAVLAVVLGMCGGGADLSQLAPMLEGLQAPAADPQEVGTVPSDPESVEEREFVEAVLGSTETLWNDLFAGSGTAYVPADLVLFSGSTSSACGGADAQVGPHYCPPDQTVYIDLDFFAELQARFGARGGDFAEAYVIAHEVAHHVQNLLGITSDVQQMQQQHPDDANDLSVRIELQADCLAGVWANSIYQRDGVLQPGDIEEGLDAAASVGDDRIQEAIQGGVAPESWTHGSSDQRVGWFTTGYESGDPNACDTFSVDL